MLQYDEKQDFPYHDDPRGTLAPDDPGGTLLL